jgi:hypothetical protein
MKAAAAATQAGLQATFAVVTTAVRVGP